MEGENKGIEAENPKPKFFLFFVQNTHEYLFPNKINELTAA